MAEEQHHHNHGEKSQECESNVISSTTIDEAAVETQDRGIFDLRGKKEEKKPEEVKHDEVPIEKCEKTEEKKGFLDKIKEKIPGQQKKVEDVPPPPPAAEYAAAETHAQDGEPKEKKGFLDKIKEKIPGQQKKAEDVSPPPPAAEPKEKNG